MKDMKRAKEVNDFIEGIDHPLKKGVEILREIILSADREITEHIKWNAPSFCYGGDDRITMNSEARIIKDNSTNTLFSKVPIHQV